jgi:multicomponent Na+:H+ antiporter subunit D
MFNHSLIKGALFMAITSMSFYLNKRMTINTLSGLGRAMPITFSCFVICSLSLAGVPLTAGFISKLYIIKASISAEGVWIALLILASSALSVIYLWKMIEAMWFHEGPKDLVIKENPTVYIALLMITFLNIYFGLDASIVVNSSFEAADQLLGVQK